MLQDLCSGTPDKFISMAAMLEDVGLPRCASYIRKFKDNRVIPGFAAAIIAKTHPDRVDEIIFQLTEIGAITL